MKIWIPRVLLGLVAVIIATVSVLALMGRRQDAGVSRASIELDASPEEIWSWLIDPDKFKQWVSWVVEVQVITPVQGVGRQTVVLMKSPGSTEPVRIEVTITEHAPPRRLAATIVSSGLFTGTQTYQLTDLAQGRTRLEVINHIRYATAPLRLLAPLTTPSATRKTEGDFATLKRLVEAEVTPTETNSAQTTKP
jgi:uncharacterized protein YndB with AHSA1/START domain